MKVTCPICNLPRIQPSGDPASAILIMTGQPTIEDIEAGKPFYGQYGMALRTEFAKFALDIFQMRMTCLWLHRMDKRNKAECEWHYAQALNECIGKKAILLLGTDATDFFLKKTATSISGLPMKSDMLSAELVMGTRSPLDIISGTTHGEFTLGIQKFCKAIKENGYIISAN